MAEREPLFPAYGRVPPMTRLQSSIVALCLTCCLLMPMSTVGLVLCIGADGHVVFETARNGHCTTPIAPTSTLSQQTIPWASPPDHCGPCVDVPLLTSDAVSQQFVPTFPLVLQLEVPGSVLVPWAVSAAPELPLRPCWLSCPRVINTILRALRTVILLV
jgi:hypothetical protein